MGKADSTSGKVNLSPVKTPLYGEKHKLRDLPCTTPRRNLLEPSGAGWNQPEPAVSGVGQSWPLLTEPLKPPGHGCRI